MIAHRFARTLVAVAAVAAMAATGARAEKPPACDLQRGCEALGVAATIPLERSPSCGTFTWCGRWTITAPGTYTATFTFTNVGHFGTGKLETSFEAPAGFAKTDDSCTGASIGPGKSCSITVTLAATEVRSYGGSQLIVHGRAHKGWNQVARIILSGSTE
jgi:hypothetical protein